MEQPSGGHACRLLGCVYPQGRLRRYSIPGSGSSLDSGREGIWAADQLVLVLLDQVPGHPDRVYLGRLLMQLQQRQSDQGPLVGLVGRGSWAQLIYL